MTEAYIEYKSDLIKPSDELYQDTDVYTHQVNSIASNISSKLKHGILPEYTFCFYCDHYLEGGSDSNNTTTTEYV
jgi:hypothetical protein